MVLFYLSIPIMLLAIAIAVVPLIWAIHHEHTTGEITAGSPVVAPQEMVTQRGKAS